MTHLLAITAAALFAIRLVFFVLLHLVPSPYSPVRHAVSDYAVGSTRPLSTGMTWTTAAAWAALAGTVAGQDGWTDRTTVIAQLVALVVIFVALPLLPTDLEEERLTRTGVLHYLAAILWFALCFSLTGNFTGHLATSAFGSVLEVLRWIALVSLIALVVALLVKPLRPLAFGVSERVFILGVTVFFGLAAVGLA